MKKDWSSLDKFRRQQAPYLSPLGAHYGAFNLKLNGVELRCIVSDGVEGMEWEHVSVHAFDPVFSKQRTPNWSEMAFIASQFWDDDECLVQYRPAKENYVNIHDHVLHWWKPSKIVIPIPPKICV